MGTHGTCEVDDAFERLRAEWRSQHDPSRFDRAADDAYEGARVPVIGRQLLTWCDGVGRGYRRFYAWHFTEAVKSEARRRGWGAYFRAYTRDQVAALYAWAKTYLHELDEAERAKQAEHGPYKHKAPERPR